MRKVLIFFLFFLLNTYLLSQSAPYDTLFYENGSIKRIGYLEDEFYSGHVLDRYYAKTDEKKLGRKTVDTIYFKERSIPPILFTRYYLDDSLMIEKIYVTSSNSTSSFPPGRIIFNVKSKFKINCRFFIHILVNKDSSISGIMAGIDSSFSIRPNEKPSYRNIQTFYDITFPSGTKITNHHFTLGQYGMVQLSFNSHFYLDFFRFYLNSNEGKEINFYLRNKIKSYGEIKSVKNLFIRDGCWKEFYENGYMKSIGKYYSDLVTKLSLEEIISMNNISFPRDGIWKYFGEDGKEILIEEYKKGELIKTRSIKPYQESGNKPR